MVVENQKRWNIRVDLRSLSVVVKVIVKITDKHVVLYNRAQP